MTAGRPRRWLYFAFPALLALFGIVSIGLGINGSSSGELYPAVHSGKDPALISGHPERIRSDEWNVGTVWTLAQVAQGFPARNHTNPGGMDAALPYDLPRREWAMAFRPHQVGYLFLDPGRATAWRWWIPGLALLAAAWAFVLAVLPRRPIVAALLATGFFFSPFFQWWYQSTTLWPIVWALATMAAVIWSFRIRSWLLRGAIVLVIGYLTVVMAMGIYAPFIIPVAIVVVLFGLGHAVGQKRRGLSWRALLGALSPLAAAGLLGGAVTELWLRQKAGTVDAFLSTAYPGVRMTPTGTGNGLSVARLLSSSFSEALTRANGFLGANSSEAATFFLVGMFLLPVAVVAIVARARRRSALPWELMALMTALVIFAAFMLLPGWNPVAHLLFLDRSTSDRLRIGIGLASFALLAYVIRYLDEETVLGREGALPGRIVSSASSLVFLISQLGIALAVVVVLGPTKLWSSAPLWWVIALSSAIVVYLFARKKIAVAAAGFLVLSVLSSFAVNPVYRGVFDLRHTAAAKAIVQLNAVDRGNWVGIGGPVVNDTLVESGVVSYNGTQGAPSRKMWNQIDPTSKYEYSWNRLGGLNWVTGTGEPVVSNPFPDQIVVTFDGCSSFAQDNVHYVFSNVRQSSSCLKRVESFAAPHAKLVIYRVVAG